MLNKKNDFLRYMIAIVLGIFTKVSLLSTIAFCKINDHDTCSIGSLFCLFFLATILFTVTKNMF